MPKQVKLLNCPHEGCEEQHLLTPDQFRVVRGKMGEKSKGGGIKRTAADDKFSRFIRQRDAFTCTVCGSQHASNSMGLHAMHYATRARDGLNPGYDKHTGIGCCLRHDPDNAAAGCWACHRKIDDDKAFKNSHFLSLLGTERFEALQQRANKTVKSVRKVS